MCLSVSTHEQKCYRGPADVEFLNLFMGNVLCFKKTSKYGATQLSIYTKDLYECSLKNIAFENTKKIHDRISLLLCQPGVYYKKICGNVAITL